MPQLVPNGLYIRNGYQITVPAILGDITIYEIFQVVITPDCFEFESTPNILDAFQKAISAQEATMPMNAQVLRSLGAWILNYRIDLTELPPYATLEDVNGLLFRKLVEGLDRVFGFPSAFDPAEVDMSFMDEEPIDPDQPAFPID